MIDSWAIHWVRLWQNLGSRQKRSPNGPEKKWI